MKRIVLLLCMFGVFVCHAQKYGGSLGLNVGNQEMGIGLKMDYNYHFKRYGFLHISALSTFGEFKVRGVRVPYESYLLMGGYSHQLWENFGRSVKLSLVGGLATGHEGVNNGHRALEGELSVISYGKWIYGPYLGGEMEFLVSDRSSLVLSGMEYFHLNSNIGKNTPYFSVGFRAYVY